MLRNVTAASANTSHPLHAGFSTGGGDWTGGRISGEIPLEAKGSDTEKSGAVAGEIGTSVSEGGCGLSGDDRGKRPFQDLNCLDVEYPISDRRFQIANSTQKLFKLVSFN
jgi:hypothetical protein